MRLLSAGQQFARRYVVDGLLAKGGMGAVYAGRQLHTEQRVAIKALWPESLGSESALRGFALEAKVAARTGSEHIVRVLDAGVDPETELAFLVMERLDGETLAERIARTGPLSIDEAVRCIRQIARALDDAHGAEGEDGQLRPIVHRDLKPENIFLVGDEAAWSVKLLDFGLATSLDRSRTLTATVKGSPLFMAPEQLDNAPVSAATDIWALGLVAFYVLTGEHYWQAAQGGATLQALLLEVSSGPLARARRRASQLGVLVPLPAGFDKWLAHCLQRSPSRRPRSAGEAAATFAQAMKRKRAGVNWVAAAAAAVLACATAGGWWLAGARPVPAPPPAPPSVEVSAASVKALAPKAADAAALAAPEPAPKVEPGPDVPPAPRAARRPAPKRRVPAAPLPEVLPPARPTFDPLEVR